MPAEVGFMDLSLIGREEALFEDDVNQKSVLLQTMVTQGRFLVIGGAGTIGKAVTLEIFKRNPKRLHVVGISENNLVELVRDIRSIEGYGTGDFKTFAVDCGGNEFAHKETGKYLDQRM
jgi:FlaA1/EpsC-like NDP-sugar epimerase